MFPTLVTLARRVASASAGAPAASPASILLNTALRQLLTSKAAGEWTVLGLDISTRVIGMAVLSAGGELLATQALKATASEHPYKIAAAVSEIVAELHDDFGLAHVAVEDILKSFTAGRFHTQGLFKLSALNGMVGYECWRRAKGSTVETYMPNSIRSAFNLSAGAINNKSSASTDGSSAGPVRIDMPNGETLEVKTRKAGGKDEATKVAVLQYVTRLYPDLAETWAVTRTGTLDKSNYDRADAILVALYGLLRHLERQALMVNDGATLRHYAAATGFDADELVRDTTSPAGGDGKSAASKKKASKSSAVVAAAPDASSLQPSSPVDGVGWRAFERLHARTMREEAQAAGADADADADEGEEQAQAAQQGQSPAANGGDQDSDDDGGSSSDDDDDDEAADASPAPLSKKKKREPPVFEGLSEAQAGRLTASYGKLRLSFSEEFKRAFIEQLVEARVAANRARRERALLKRKAEQAAAAAASSSSQPQLA